MKILITGATGMIGKELGKKLVSAGHEVVAISRSRDSAEKTLPFQAIIHEWKSSQEDFPATAFAGVEAVVNLMGENLADQRWTESFKKKLIESRVTTTQKMVESVQQNRNHLSSSLKIWIQGSAIGYYGASQPAQVFDETSSQGSGFLAQLCANWEAPIIQLPAEVRTVIARTGVVFSHQGGAFAKMVEPMMGGVAGIVGSGEQQMSLIHLDDEVRFLLQAIENEKVKGAFNLVIDQPISQREVTEKIAAHLWVKPGPTAPAVAIKLALGEMGSLLLDSEAVTSLRLKEIGFTFQYPDAESIVAEVTSWHRHPFAEKSVSLRFGEQFVPKPREELFEFFADAQNLETLTPKWLHFKIKQVSTPQLEKGTKIRYQLRLYGVPFTWLTDIAEWDRPYRFVDNQQDGPYTLWYHQHTFEAVPGGTLIRDWVRFEVPLGNFGRWTAGFKVRQDVGKIFEYRRQKIHEIFPQTRVN